MNWSDYDDKVLTDISTYLLLSPELLFANHMGMELGYRFWSIESARESGVDGKLTLDGPYLTLNMQY